MDRQLVIKTLDKYAKTREDIAQIRQRASLYYNHMRPPGIYDEGKEQTLQHTTSTKSDESRTPEQWRTIGYRVYS